MLELRIIKGANMGAKFELPLSGSIVIGRENDCGIVLASKGISKKHCRITALPGGRLEIEDLQSSNGTFVNGVLVKKHIVKFGDILNLHDFSLQVAKRIPDAVNSIAGGANMFDASAGVVSDIPAGNISVPETNEKTGLNRWFDKNLFPIADSLSDKFDLRFLMFFFFLFWSALVIALTAAPFRDKANQKILEQSTEVAKLYARQLARVNQQAIVDQRFRDLISDLDARPGQTPGILNALILDATSSQILAPAEFFGQGLPSVFAATAVNKDSEFLSIDTDGTVYASAPIKIGSTNGNKTVATAFVVLSSTNKNFSVPALFEQIVDSLLKALVVSCLFLIFIYRWTEGSLLLLSQRVDMAMKKSENSVQVSLKWPALQNLAEQISAALGRAGQGAAGAQDMGGEGVWAQATVNNIGGAAASFDSSLRVTAWNMNMERVVGIRAAMAVGSDISGASRDVSFESVMRDLANAASAMPWSPQQKSVEFSGKNFMASVVYGQGSYLLNLSPMEE